jgi:uncharacterized membrane protein
MSDTRLPRGIFLAIILVALAQAAYNFSVLPYRLASHFSASGVPNGWMTKQAFFIVYVAMVLIAAVVEFLVPLSITKSANPRLNMPHKDYWLAPGQRAETIAYVAKSLAWYGCAILLLEVLTMGLAIQANFSSPPRLPATPMMTLLISFALYNVFWITRMVRRFSSVPPTV